MIEGLLLVDKFIDQVAIIADQRKYVSALIVPEFRVLEEWAKDFNIDYDSREALCSNLQVNKMMKERIATLLQLLAPYEQIKTLYTITTPFLSREWRANKYIKTASPNSL